METSGRRRIPSRRQIRPPPTPARGRPTLATLRDHQFPRHHWSASLYALVVLADFVKQSETRLDGSGTSYTFDTIFDPVTDKPDAATLQQDLDELFSLIEFRPAVMSEALAQRNNISAYWRGAFLYGNASHPFTYDLTQAALRVGEFQAMFYKNMFNRPRASQLLPSLMPPVDVPGHPSYPSAHATEFLPLVGLPEIGLRDGERPAAGDGRDPDRIPRCP